MEIELRCPISADLSLIRSLVRRRARDGGLRGERLDDLVIAVNEAVTNVHDHGDGTGMVIVRGSRDAITVDIVDYAGRLTRDHLANARLDPAGVRGFGLWLIQHVCDHVEFDRTEEGSRLRLRMYRPFAPASRLPHGTKRDGSAP